MNIDDLKKERQESANFWSSEYKCPAVDPATLLRELNKAWAHCANRQKPQDYTQT